MEPRPDPVRGGAEIMHPESIDLQHRWPLVNGFGLTPGDTAIVAGAYKGKVCRLLKEMYDCGGIGFEPQRWAYNCAVEAMYDYPDWAILPYGLGVPGFVGNLAMSEFGTDACGVDRVTREVGHGYFLEASQLLMGLIPPNERIALFVCNMEGFEYRLIPHLAMTGWINRMDRLAIQWHRDLGNDENHDRIQAVLRYEGMKLIVDDSPAWQYWVRDTDGTGKGYDDDMAKGP